MTVLKVKHELHLHSTALCVCHLGPLPSALRASPGMTAFVLEKDENAQTTLAPPSP
jgi:hypothetical protein